MVIDTEIAVTTIPNPNSVKLRRIKIPITFFNFPADTIYIVIQSNPNPPTPYTHSVIRAHQTNCPRRLNLSWSLFTIVTTINRRLDQLFRQREDARGAAAGQCDFFFIARYIHQRDSDDLCLFPICVRTRRLALHNTQRILLLYIHRSVAHK